MENKRITLKLSPIQGTPALSTQFNYVKCYRKTFYLVVKSGMKIREMHAENREECSNVTKICDSKFSNFKTGFLHFLTQIYSGSVSTNTSMKKVLEF